MSTRIFNVLRNINSLARFREAVRKIRNRLTDKTDYVALENELASLVESFETWGSSLDEQALSSAKAFAKAHAAETSNRLSDAPIPLGGAAHLELLYFLVLVSKPKVVVETGVAAGHSSQTLLSALREVGEDGRLYSSDFPYLKEENPDTAIGWVVDAELKDHWFLAIDGDRENLPKILENIQPKPVDLIHYDSDKSEDGRKFALDTLAPSISDRTTIIFDDIQDNYHFLNWVRSEAMRNRNWKIFGIGKKYVGVVYPNALKTQ